MARPALVDRVAAAALAVGAWSPIGVGCSPDVTGGTRDLDEDACVCDCELGCGPEGPERPEGDDQAAATASGETSATGAGGAGGATVDGAGGSTADGGGGAGADGGGGAGGSAGVACVEGMSRIAVSVDGDAVETCAVDASLGALNHVTATLSDGHTLIVSFTGQSPADDACVGVAMRRPGNTSSENDWQSGSACELRVSAYDERVIGTFAATLAPVSDVELGQRVLTAGQLDLARR